MAPKTSLSARTLICGNGCETKASVESVHANKEGRHVRIGFGLQKLAENMLVLLRDSACVMLFGFLASDFLVEVSRYKR